MKNRLWCDLKTDQERAEFLRSGRAWETGIIAESIAGEVADAFEFRAKFNQQFVESDANVPCTHLHKESCISDICICIGEACKGYAPAT